MKAESPPSSSSTSTLPRPTRQHNLENYSIGRGEYLVLTHEPYKSFILPHWKFRTVAIATASAKAIYAIFLRFYDETQDFVGMDMCRKYLQMGMTRAKRYANFKGGRKYDYVKSEEGEDVKGEKIQREKGKDHEGKEEKEKASLVFRGWWDKARAHEGYKQLKEEWQKEKKEWEKNGKPSSDVKSEDAIKRKESNAVKAESASEEEPPKKRTRVKREDT